MSTKASSTSTAGSTPKKKRATSTRAPDSVAIDKIRAALETLPPREQLRVLGYVMEPLEESLLGRCGVVVNADANERPKVAEAAPQG